MATPTEANGIAELRAQLETMNSRLQALAQRNDELELQIMEAVPAGIPQTPNPVYELLEPWNSPDDIYYPAGAQFEDITGGMICPNEHMVPLNAAAERRMREYLSSLPDETRTPPLDLIVQAAMEVRPREGEDPKTLVETQKLILGRALELQMEQRGVIPRSGPAPVKGRTMPAIPGDVPLMPNTRIHGSSTKKSAPATRLQRAPVAPANKGVPVIGSRSELIASRSGI